MHAAYAPTPGTTRPSASSAVSRSAVERRPRRRRARARARRSGGCPSRSRGRRSGGRSERALGRGHARSRAGRCATASRNARANALNCVSTMWCGSRPASTRTCSARWAWNASVSKTCRVSEPVRSRRRCVDVLLALGLAGVHAVGAAGHVDDGLHQRLVERHGGVAEPADAELVAERLAQRLAEHDRGVLDGVVGVDVECRPRSGRSGRAARAGRTRRACGRRSRRRWRRRCGRCRRGRPRRGPSTPWSAARSRAVRCSSVAPFQWILIELWVQCLLERRHLVGGADRHPQPAVRAGLADQHAAVEQPLPDSMPVGERSRTTRSWRRSRRPGGPAPRSQATVASRSARSSSTVPSSSGACRSAAQRDRLGDRGQVVGQPDDADRVADRRVGGEVADAGRRPARTPCSWCG